MDGKSVNHGDAMTNSKSGTAGHDRKKSGQPATVGHKLHESGHKDVRGSVGEHAKITGKG